MYLLNIQWMQLNLFDWSHTLPWILIEHIMLLKKFPWRVVLNFAINGPNPFLGIISVDEDKRHMTIFHGMSEPDKVLGSSPHISLYSILILIFVFLSFLKGSWYELETFALPNFLDLYWVDHWFHSTFLFIYDFVNKVEVVSHDGVLVHVPWLLSDVIFTILCGEYPREIKAFQEFFLLGTLLKV